MPNTVLDPGDVEVNKIRSLVFRYSVLSLVGKTAIEAEVQCNITTAKADRKRESDFSVTRPYKLTVLYSLLLNIITYLCNLNPST